MVEAKIGDDPVNPRIERALKPEIAYAFVGFEERILVNVLGVLFRACEVESETQDCLIVMAHEFFERRAVPALRLSHQLRIVNAAQILSVHLPLGGEAS